MTCKPIVGHPLDALYQSAKRYPGGIEALAKRVKMTESTLYKKLRHQVETHHLGYDDELSEILFCLQEAGVRDWSSTLHAFCWRHGLLVVPAPTDVMEDSGEMTAAIVESVREHADAISAVGDALRGDKVIDATEMSNIDQQIEEAMAALASIRAIARRKHEADFPAVRLRKA